MFVNLEPTVFQTDRLEFYGYVSMAVYLQSFTPTRDSAATAPSCGISGSEGRHRTWVTFPALITGILN